MDYFEEINQIDYIFLYKVEELKDNLLSIVIDVGKVANYEEETLVGKARPVLIDNNCTQYQIIFNKVYVAYQIINESFETVNDYDQFIGRRIRKYSQSNYLDYILKHTIADYIFPAEMKHYGIICQNQIIDVISLDDPVIVKYEQ